MAACWHPNTITCVRAAVHFWAPTFKWAISLANIADLQRPPEKISLPQQLGKAAMRATMCTFDVILDYIFYYALLQHLLQLEQ